MLNGVCNENGKNKSKGLISKKKKKLCTCSTLFLYISLTLFCTTTSWNFLLTHLMWEMSYVLTKSFVACVPVRSFFFTAAHFHFADHYHFSCSHRQFSCFSFNEIGLLCFLSNALAFSLSSKSVKTLKLLKSDLTLWLFFLSKTSGWPCDFPPKTSVLHLGCHTCWLSYFTLVCLWCGRACVRSRD